MKANHFFLLLVTLLMGVSCNGVKDNLDGTDDGNGGAAGVDYSDTDQLVWVDMGTSVLWCTMNLGAERSTDFGTYMEYSNVSGSYGEEFKSCRLPTKADYEELATVKTADGKYTPGPCSTKWVKVNGVAGYKYTNKNNGNVIFIPAAGYYGQGIPYFIGKKVVNWTLDSRQDQYGLRATTTEFQEGAAPYAGAFEEPYAQYERCPMRLVKEK